MDDGKSALSRTGQYNLELSSQPPYITHHITHHITHCLWEKHISQYYFFTLIQNLRSEKPPGSWCVIIWRGELLDTTLSVYGHHMAMTWILWLSSKTSHSRLGSSYQSSLMFEALEPHSQGVAEALKGSSSGPERMEPPTHRPFHGICYAVYLTYLLFSSHLAAFRAEVE